MADKNLAKILTGMIWTWAFLALGSMFFILCGRAGEIPRSSETCYPIPEEVAKRLMARKTLDGLRNIQGDEAGSSYCIRCLVWRRKSFGDTKSVLHHCQTCQRFVSGFDHHCGVFGRCIVAANMSCFVTMITMFFFALITTGVAVIGSGDPE